MAKHRRARRRGTGRAAVVGLLVLVGLLGAPVAPGRSGDAGSEQSREQRGPALAYHCDTDTGSGRSAATVRIGLSLPAEPTVGDVVHPRAFTVSVELADPVRAEFLERGVGEVLGTVGVTVDTARDGDGGESGRAELAVPATSVRPDAALRVTATGDGAPITFDTAGEWRISARTLTLLLAGEPSAAVPGEGEGGEGEDGEDGRADGGRGEDGATAPVPGAIPDADVVTLDCAPDSGQDTTVATVAVAGTGAGGPDGPPGPSTEPNGPGPLGEDGPPGHRVSPEGDPPPDCAEIGDADTAWCAYLGGYANVNGLDAAMLLTPGVVNLGLDNAGICDDGSGFICQDTVAELNDGGEQRFPLSRNHFHAFGFVPNSATVELRQVGDMSIEVRFHPSTWDGSVVASARMSIRLHDVTVNGEDLPVGEHCRTVEPVDVELVADYPGSYSVVEGGFLDGFVDVPPFSGCGRNGELDPLLTGLISGSDNYLKLTQGRVCDIRNGDSCPPSVPEPQR